MEGAREEAQRGGQKEKQRGEEEVVNFVGVECLGNDGRGAEGGFGVARNLVHCGFCNFADHEAQGGGDVEGF